MVPTAPTAYWWCWSDPIAGKRRRPSDGDPCSQNPSPDENVCFSLVFFMALPEENTASLSARVLGDSLSGNDRQPPKCRLIEGKAPERYGPNQQKFSLTRALPLPKGLGRCSRRTGTVYSTDREFVPGRWGTTGEPVSRVEIFRSKVVRGARMPLRSLSLAIRA